MGSHEGIPIDLQEQRLKKPATSSLAQCTHHDTQIINLEEIIQAKKDAKLFLKTMIVWSLGSYYPQFKEGENNRTTIKQRGRALLFKELVWEDLIVPVVTTSNTIGKPRIDEEIVKIPIGASRINEDLSDLSAQELQQRCFQFARAVTSAVKLCSENPKLMFGHQDLSYLYLPLNIHP